MIGKAREERGKGVPLDDAQRVARHYGIAIQEACDLLAVYTVEQLLPERGYGLTERPQLQGHTVEELRIALNAMEQALPLGGKAKLQLYSEALPSQEDLAIMNVNLVGAGFHTSYPTARIVQGVPTTELILTKGSPQWAAIIPIIPTIAIVGLIAFGITQIETISKALLPLLITIGVTASVLLIGVLRTPARKAAERTVERYLPKA